MEVNIKLMTQGKGALAGGPPLVLGLMFTLNTRTEYRTVAHEVDTVSSL